MSCLYLYRVTKRFGGVSAVNNISLEFEEGKIAALIGPNGAGKTTLFNLIGGQIRPDEGEILCDGVNLSRKNPWQVAKAGVGRMFQDARVFQNLSVRDNVMLAFPGQAGESAMWSLFARPAVGRQEFLLNKQANALLKTVGLLDDAGRRARELSYGQQKLLAVARLLASRPRVLLLDEPTAGVTPRTAEKILGILRGVAAAGNTVVVIEHNMNIVSQFVDVVHFMEWGRVILSGLPEAILEESHVKHVYLGAHAV